MIATALAALLMSGPQAAPSLAHVTQHTMEMCWRGRGHPAPPTANAYPEVSDASHVIVRTSASRCDIYADDWVGDQGEVLNYLLAGMAAEPDGDWEAVETRAEQVNERGPALWSQFVRHGADGREAGWITLIEPAAGRRGFFELTYVVMEP